MITPYFEDTEHGIQIYCGDCLEIMPELDTASIDAVITDPPYGINKAEWDTVFPIEWYLVAKTIAPFVGIITGSAQLNITIPLVGDDYIETIVGRNLNGMSFSPIGFGNWLACVIAGNRPKSGVTFFEFSVRGAMPEHPSPKPIEYMHKLVTRLTKIDNLILDPFLGSGTTAVAAIRTGRRCIGIEISEEYCELATRRIKEVLAQKTLDLGVTA